MKKRHLRVGVAQMECVLGDVDANLEIAADFVARAKQEGVELLVFPELALSGYAIGGRFHKAALRPHGPRARRLRELSRDVAFAIGLIEETEDHEFYNSGLFLSDGNVRHVHRKVYLPNYRQFDERRYFGAGSVVQAFNTPWGRMAMLVCGDAWHLSLPYLAVHDGADLLMIMAASSREGLAENIPCEGAWERMNRSYALTLSTFVVFANRAGSEAGLHFWGGSHVVLPNGNLLCKAKIDEQDLLVCDLDLAQLREQRMVLPFRRDDSLPFTLQLGHRILESKTHRRNGFFSEMVSPELADPNVVPELQPQAPSEFVNGDGS